MDELSGSGFSEPDVNDSSESEYSESDVDDYDQWSEHSEDELIDRHRNEGWLEDQVWDGAECSDRSDDSGESIYTDDETDSGATTSDVSLTDVEGEIIESDRGVVYGRAILTPASTKENPATVGALHLSSPSWFVCSHAEALKDVKEILE